MQIVPKLGLVFCCKVTSPAPFQQPQKRMMNAKWPYEQSVTVVTLLGKDVSQSFMWAAE